MKTFNEIIVYDGTCVSCNKFINYVLAYDGGLFRLLTQGSAKYNFYTENYDFADQAGESICLISGDQIYFKSEAVRRILARCGKFNAFLALLLWLVPRSLRDFAYSLFSRHRYRFQKHEQCPVPSSNLLTRLI